MIRKFVLMVIVASMVLSLGVSSAKASEIKGFTFYDANKNGIMDDGEPGLSGFTIKLLLGGLLTNTAVTDANGFYDFTNLAQGNYRVCEEPPPGQGWRPLAFQCFNFILGTGETREQDFPNIISSSHHIIPATRSTISTATGCGIRESRE